MTAQARTVTVSYHSLLALALPALMAFVAIVILAAGKDAMFVMIYAAVVGALLTGLVREAVKLRQDTKARKAELS